MPAHQDESSLKKQPNAEQRVEDQPAPTSQPATEEWQGYRPEILGSILED
jgi:hypothetical protein